MIQNDQKTSLLIPYQLPEFIRDNPEYSNFVTFVQAYYEWMEQNDNVTDRTKNILNYTDVDKTTSEFINYYINDFLPYFPQDALLDKKTALKFAKELYQSKGTIASYKFLFKVLYDSDFDIFYTKDAILRASDGLWYVSKSLKLSTTDPNFLLVNNYRLFGETTKTIATIENAVKSGSKTEVFISNIERLFQSGEFVRVVDSNNQDVLFDGQTLRAKIVGQISQIKIDPKNRGLFYQPGDPVVVYDGLNSNTGIGATATVGETTKGSIQRINVLTGGYGYTTYPNTSMSITSGGGATAVVGSLTPYANVTARVTYAPKDTITLKSLTTIGNTNYHFSNIAISNANTTLANALSFDSFLTYPISSVLVTFGGGGISTAPTVEAISTFPNDLDGAQASVKSLGILAPIQITSAGTGYRVNDKIVFSGGSGYGAYANVTAIGPSGEITEIKYVHGPSSYDYPLGGMGYLPSSLPTITINSTGPSAANAVVYVPGILGDGADFGTVVDRVGSVTSINITNPGEDYIATPNVSLKVQDIVVSNVAIYDLPQKMDVAYQGENISGISYKSIVDSIDLYLPDSDPLKSKYILRLFNYTSAPDPEQLIKIENKNINMHFAKVVPDASYDKNGIKTYGDGTAKGVATYLNGLVLGQGQYLNSQGQPSSYSVLESETYNNYTYLITVQKEIAKYRDILLNLLHPSGMKMLGRYKLLTAVEVPTSLFHEMSPGYPLAHYTNNTSSYVQMTSDFTNLSNNIVVFGNMNVANIANFIYANTILEIESGSGVNVRSRAVSVDHSNNEVTLETNTWLTYPNVAYVTGTTGTNTINITSLTGSYDIINNAQYSDPYYPLKDIVYIGDSISVPDNSIVWVDSIDYENGIIYLANNLTNSVNSLMSVRRTFNTTQVKILNQIGSASIND
jgi:hypothetical protein